MKLEWVPIRFSMCLNRFSSVKAKALIGTFQRSYYDGNFREISLRPVMATLRCSGIHSYGATVQYEIGDIYETPFYWICFSTTKVAISIYGLANYAAHSAIRRDTSCAETGEIVPVPRVPRVPTRASNEPLRRFYNHSLLLCSWKLGNWCKDHEGQVVWLAEQKFLKPLVGQDLSVWSPIYHSDVLIVIFDLIWFLSWSNLNSVRYLNERIESSFDGSYI